MATIKVLLQGKESWAVTYNKRVNSADKRLDCTFCSVWSWSTLSTKASWVVNSKERIELIR